MPLVRRAGKRVVADTLWKVGSSGLFAHTESGHWGQVSFRVAWGRDQNLSLTSGALSPYLMRVLNELDPQRNPPPDFIAAHAQTEWFQRLNYVEDYEGEPVSDEPRCADPTADDVGQSAPSTKLGPNCAERWIEARMAHLLGRTQPLLTDTGLRDWQLTQLSRLGGVKQMNLRYAILLTRHLRLDDELPGLVADAAQAYERDIAAYPDTLKYKVQWDRRKTYKSRWSHDRFMRVASLSVV
jgi:hypothetical protein